GTSGWVHDKRSNKLCGYSNHRICYGGISDAPDSPALRGGAVCIPGTGIPGAREGGPVDAGAGCTDVPDPEIYNSLHPALFLYGGPGGGCVERVVPGVEEKDL